MKNNKKTNNVKGLLINDIHDEGLVNYFQANIGKKVFLLMEAFPFMFIGKIKDVIDDVAVLKVKTTSIPALEDKEWLVHIHSIETFYIETEQGPKIPDLKD
ncbi:hypothetical protein [Bacillus sp. Hm123]|uniref:hypothetical protein n=1 Tax=Bacillus sp. Hm123 TaxID=3450745 RepID=UPI003F431967